jgi:polar amino acid transport system substrate-binding protein
MARRANGERGPIHGGVIMRIHEFLLAARLDETSLETWVEAGWLIPRRDAEAAEFSEADLARAHLIRDLQHDMGVNEEAIPIILDLIDQVHGLRHMLRDVATAVCVQPEDMRQRIVAEIATSTSLGTADPRIADLVQGGKIHLAVFLPQYTKDPATGEIRPVGTGFVAAELVRALAGRLGIAMQLIGYPTPLKAIEGIKAGECDLALMGIEPSRVIEVDFTPPVVQFDYTFLVPAGSTIQSATDADRPGIRIAVVRNHASTLTLSRIVKHAELVGSDLPDAAFDLLRGGKAHLFAAPREVLMDYAAALPGSRVLADAYGVNNIGVAIAKGAAGRLAYISEFVDAAKASGLLRGAIERGGLPTFRVAPRETAKTQ